MGRKGGIPVPDRWWRKSEENGWFISKFTEWYYQDDFDYYFQTSFHFPGRLADDKHKNEKMETQAWKQQQSQVVSFKQGRTLVTPDKFFRKLRIFPAVNFYTQKHITEGPSQAIWYKLKRRLHWWFLLRFFQGHPTDHFSGMCSEGHSRLRYSDVKRLVFTGDGIGVGVVVGVGVVSASDKWKSKIGVVSGIRTVPVSSDSAYDSDPVKTRLSES